MKTKLLFLLVCAVVVIFGFNYYSHRASKTLIVGNDVDQHGCKASAGYTFSKVKNSCIRIFESGIRMNPQDKSLDQTLSAFAVFKSETEDDQAEIFLPNSSDTVILSRLTDNGAGTWGNSLYKLSQWKGMYTLEDASGKTLYQGSVTN